MPKYRMTLKMSQNGRSSRDNHSITFLISVAAALTQASAKTLSDAVGGVLRGVMFNQTTIVRATFALLDANGKAIKGGSKRTGLGLAGLNAIAAGDAAAPDHVVLAIEKSSADGQGVTILRHVLSSEEYSDYTITGTVPARFETLPVGAVGAGTPLDTALRQAFNSAGATLHLPAIKINGVLTERIVTEINTLDFRLYSPHRSRVKAATGVIQSIQRQLNLWAKQAWDLFKKFVGGVIPADVVTTIAALAAKAAAVYLGLDVTQRVLLNPPEFPALPAG